LVRFHFLRNEDGGASDFQITVSGLGQSGACRVDFEPLGLKHTSVAAHILFI
jgi:hypothetical protein